MPSSLVLQAPPPVLSPTPVLHAAADAVAAAESRTGDASAMITGLRQRILAYFCLALRCRSARLRHKRHALQRQLPRSVISDVGIGHRLSHQDAHRLSITHGVTPF